jgi:hypothetical protein
MGMSSFFQKLFYIGNLPSNLIANRFNDATIKKNLLARATRFMNLKYAPKLKQTTTAKLWPSTSKRNHSYPPHLQTRDQQIRRFWEGGVNAYIETGNFELADDTMTATQKLLDRLWYKQSDRSPDSQTCSKNR